MHSFKVRFLDIFADGVVWFAALSIASATGLLLSEIFGH